VTATITVAVGWTSQRPVIPDQHISYVTVPLVDLSEPGPYRRRPYEAGPLAGLRDDHQPQHRQ
jgi:hypothetical protein